MFRTKLLSQADFRMGKGFKLRFSLIHSLQFCRFRNPSTLPETPAPAAQRLSTVNHKALDIVFPAVPDPPPSTPCHPLHGRLVSTGCGCRRGSDVMSESSYDCDTESLEYSWKKDGKWHVISRICDDCPRQKICYSPCSGDSDGDLSSVQPPKVAKGKKVRKKKKKGSGQSVRTSTSSGDSGWFSSEGGDYEEETETLLSSSRSFSNDSSFELNHQLETITEESKSGRMNKPKKARRLKRSTLKNCGRGSSSSGNGNPKPTSSPEAESPAKVSMLLGRMPCKLRAKVRESFAVVKKSNDPYEDFKKSMVEMIMEKQMFEAEDLEQLLLCFLSLNSPQHHGIIVEAFSAVWEGLVRKSPPSFEGL